MGLTVTLLPWAATSREVAGVQLADEAWLADGVTLPLTGAGVFRYFLLSVYLCGLYLPPRSAWQGGPLHGDSARRVSLTMLVDVSARLFIWGLDKGLSDNTPAAELTALAGQTEALRVVIRDIGRLKRGERVDIDYLPGHGTQIRVGGRAAADAIPGKALNDAVLRAWIGERPLDARLKEALLGA
jgi:hypothetical protein